MMDWKAACVVLGLGLGALASVTGLAQTAMTGAEGERLEGKSRQLAITLAEALTPSRLPEIYADLRRAVRDAYLPALRDTLSGSVPGGGELEAAEKEEFEKTAALLDYALKASDELEPFLAENRESLIGDIATLHAKYLRDAEIEALGELAAMPAMRKIFNTGYMASRLITGYSYEDMRSYYLEAGWLSEVKRRFENSPGLLTPETAPPPPERIAEANAIIADFIRVSRIDEMVAEMTRFMREAAAEAEAGDGPGGEASAQSQLRWLEFVYNLQKSFVITMGPPMLASVLDDAQLARLRLLILSPVMGKTFTMLFETVRAATSLTGEDVRALQAFSQRAEREGLFEKRTTGQESQLQLETQALAEIWWERARQRLSPGTRHGLDKAIAEFERMESLRGLQTPKSDL